jgi:hypothetical protein
MGGHDSGGSGVPEGGEYEDVACYCTRVDGMVADPA